MSVCLWCLQLWFSWPSTSLFCFISELNETVDDAESDPEYNLLADTEDKEDVEDYRNDKSVQVTSKWGSTWFNSLASVRFEHSLKLINFKLISTINILSILCEIAIRWGPKYLTGHWSTLVQVMAWCRQATSHYLRQCWPRSLSPYDITRPQWVNTKLRKTFSMHFLVWKLCYFDLNFKIRVQLTIG